MCGCYFNGRRCWKPCTCMCHDMKRVLDLWAKKMKAEEADE